MMGTKNIESGIRFLIFFYCFALLQNIMLRSRFQTPAAWEAVVLGTLVYLIIGFIRKTRASRWVAIGFHTVFQITETIAFFTLLHSGVPEELAREMPSGMPVPVSLIAAVAFFIVTGINLGAITYLLKNKKYFASCYN